MDWILLFVILSVDHGYGLYPSEKDYLTEAECRSEMGAATPVHLAIVSVRVDPKDIIAVSCVRRNIYQNYVACFISDEHGNDQCPYRHAVPSVSR